MDAALCKFVGPRQMIEEILVFVYTALALILGWFFLVYFERTLQGTKTYDVRRNIQIHCGRFLLDHFYGVNCILDA